MNTPKILRKCLLSATLTAMPVVCLATDAPSPPTPAASRHSTASAQRDQTIQQTGYQAARTSDSRVGTAGQQPATSTVQAELNRMLHSGGPAAAVTTKTAVATQSERSSNIKQVQHRSENRSRPPQKEGFLKRWYRKVTGNNEVEPNVVQPGPQIPSPPPIDYRTRQSDAAPRDGIPALPAGYHSGEASRQQPGSGTAMPSQSDYSSDPTRDAHAKPAQDNRFISPFEEDAVSDPDEALLDLDSLIRDRRDTSQTPENRNADAEGVDSADQLEETEPAVEVVSESASPVESSDSATPVVSSEFKSSQQAKDNSGEASQPSEDPFTGYQLPSDGELLAQPQADDQAGPEPAPPVFAEPTTETGSDALPDQADPIVIKVPLLEEPVMALPRAIPEQRQDQQSLQPAEEPVFHQQPVSRSQPAPVDATPKPVPDSVISDSVNRLPQQSETPDGPSVGAPDLRALDTQAKREQQRFRIMSRTGQSGFKGFCPVELRDHRELADAREQYRAKFGLQTYYFSSPEARSAFEANPARYAPAGGGSDVVLLVNTGEETPGSLDFSLWYRDRLYMFRSRETQAMFSQDPRRYADQY